MVLRGKSWEKDVKEEAGLVFVRWVDGGWWMAHEASK